MPYAAMIFSYPSSANYRALWGGIGDVFLDFPDFRRSGGLSVRPVSGLPPLPPQYQFLLLILLKR